MKTCTYCDKPAKRAGLCWTHLSRQRKGQPLDAPIRQRRTLPDDCKVEGCLRRPVAHDLCDLHYRRAKRGGDLETGYAGRSDYVIGELEACLWGRSADDLASALGYSSVKHLSETLCRWGRSDLADRVMGGRHGVVQG